MNLLERDDALAVLTRAWDHAARGKGQAVVITGEPGIGKTALVSRFIRDRGSAGRVLIGTCDDLMTPRPLGPIRDLVGAASPPLAEALARAAVAAHEIQRLVIAELERRPHPTLLVLEDVHWADDATLDVISFVGRRIGSLPAVLALTFRAGEVAPDHPIHAAVAAIGPGDAVHVSLAPLSSEAVSSLAGHARDSDLAGGVYQLTGGNPFYVSELLGARSADPLPPSIGNAVLARASRLGAAERRLVELVSVVPSRMSTTLLDVVMPGWPSAAEEPERRQLLEVHPRFVRFRHELARHAIRASVPLARRRRLHAETLAALLAADADPADIVHHAEAAGDETVVAAHVLVAARRAAALGSNREAFAHYRRAADFLGGRPVAEQASVFEGLALAAYGAGRFDAAFVAVERAIAAYRTVDDRAGLGRSTRLLSRLHWFAGDGALARRATREAIEILEPLGDSAELARAISERSQVAMLAEEGDEAIALGRVALDMATRLGDERTRAHAMVNIGSVRIQRDPDDERMLLDAHAIADASGDGHEATRALGNLAYTQMEWVRHPEALAMATRALVYAEEHEVHVLVPYVSMVIAWLRLRAGAWDEAEPVIRATIAAEPNVTQLLARLLFAELAIRRGDADAAERLADVAARAERSGEPQRIGPALELACEWALLTGGPFPVDGLIRLLDRLLAADLWAGRLTAWASVAGIPRDHDAPASLPHGAMIHGDWQAAADAFGDAGWNYDQSLMLSLLDDEAALADGLEIARSLGAEPLTRRIMNRMRDLGLAVPRGRRATTRANPAGLTARQVEVLELVTAGLTNADIAKRLFISPRTAEHHVAAVLIKVGATTRRDAARRAVELGSAPDRFPGAAAVSDR